MNSNSNDQDTTWIPEGYVEVMGPNGQRYLVPEFCTPALLNTLDVYEEKNKLEIKRASGTVSFPNCSVPAYLAVIHYYTYRPLL